MLTIQASTDLEQHVDERWSEVININSLPIYLIIWKCEWFILKFYNII